MTANRCVNHPDRPGAYVRSDGLERCDECARPWLKLADRQRRERDELAARHGTERAALHEAEISDG